MAWLEAMGQADLPELGVLVAPPEQTRRLRHKRMQETEDKEDTAKEETRAC
jgi:hypothetical protein